jgi:hypothetical protein
MKNPTARLRKLEAAAPKAKAVHLWNGRHLSDLTREELLQAWREAWAVAEAKLMMTASGRRLVMERRRLLEQYRAPGGPPLVSIDDVLVDPTAPPAVE